MGLFSSTIQDDKALAFCRKCEGFMIVDFGGVKIADNRSKRAMEVVIVHYCRKCRTATGSETVLVQYENTSVTIETLKEIIK